VKCTRGGCWPSMPLRLLPYTKGSMFARFLQHGQVVFVAAAWTCVSWRASSVAAVTQDTPLGGYPGSRVHYTVPCQLLVMDGSIYLISSPGGSCARACAECEQFTHLMSVQA
jgi:hypothetical protein